MTIRFEYTAWDSASGEMKLFSQDDEMGLQSVFVAFRVFRGPTIRVVPAQAEARWKMALRAGEGAGFFRDA
jgi:hypothetical protein